MILTLHDAAPYYSETNPLICSANQWTFFLNLDSLHPRLNSHNEAWSYKKGSTKKITGYRKSAQKEPTVKRYLLILDLKPLTS